MPSQNYYLVVVLRADVFTVVALRVFLAEGRLGLVGPAVDVAAVAAATALALFTQSADVLRTTSCALAALAIVCVPDITSATNTALKELLYSRPLKYGLPRRLFLIYYLYKVLLTFIYIKHISMPEHLFVC